MNEKTAKLINKYSSAVAARVAEGRQIPARGMASLRNRIRSAVMKRWLSTPGPRRHKLRSYIRQELRQNP
jgi:hypothetical protein